jgi:hypothetical protein
MTYDEQREAHMFQVKAKEADAAGKRDGLARYRKERPSGMSRRGILATFERLVFSGPDKAPLLNLNMPDVGHEPLGPWEPKDQAP